MLVGGSVVLVGAWTQASAVCWWEAASCWSGPGLRPPPSAGGKRRPAGRCLDSGFRRLLVGDGVLLVSGWVLQHTVSLLQ